MLSLGACAPRQHFRPAAAVLHPDPSPPSVLRAPIDLLVDEDAVVRVVARGVYCSGTLISDDLVLTAHHCVAERHGAEVMPIDLVPADVYIELGGGHWPWARAEVRAIVAPPCGFRSGHGDIAVLVLSRKLVGMPTMRMRLDRPVAVGEPVEVIGYGRCLASQPGVGRVHRIGGPVRAVGFGAFWADAPMCPGDSGGAVVHAGTGEVLGVAAAAEMDPDDRTADPSFFTRVSVWSSLFAAARAVAAGDEPDAPLPIAGCELR